MSAFKRLVGTRFVSVSSKVVFVLKNLFRSGKMSVRALFRGCGGRPEIVATFLAVLELVRHGRIDVSGTDENGEVLLNKEKNRRMEREDQWT